MRRVHVLPPVLVLGALTACAERPVEVDEHTQPGWIETGTRQFIDGVVHGLEGDELVVTRAEHAERSTDPDTFLVDRLSPTGERLASWSPAAFDDLFRRRHFVRADGFGVVHVMTLASSPGTLTTADNSVAVGGTGEAGSALLFLNRDGAAHGAHVALVEDTRNLGVAFFPDNAFVTATASNPFGCHVTLRRHAPDGVVTATLELAGLCKDGVADPQLYPLPDRGVLLQLTSRHLQLTLPAPVAGPTDLVLDDVPAGAWDTYLLAFDRDNRLLWARVVRGDDSGVEQEDQLYLGAASPHDEAIVLCGNVPAFRWLDLLTGVELGRNDDDRRSSGAFVRITADGTLAGVARTGPDAGHKLQYCAVDDGGVAWAVDSQVGLWRSPSVDVAEQRPILDGLFLTPTGFALTHDSVVVSGIAAEAARVPLLGNQIAREESFLLSIDVAALSP